MNTKKNIAILAGGDSSEFGISMLSASVVEENIKANYNTYLIEIKSGEWNYLNNGNRTPINKDDFSLSIANQKITFDLAFIAIHGTPGEDGKLQGYFDILGIKYSTSGLLASSIGFNKGVCNDYLKNHGIKVAKSIQLFTGIPYKNENIVTELGLPCFVKPNQAGSSYGVSKVREAHELAHAIEEAFKHDKQVLIESFLDGREVTCGAHNFSGKPTAMPITEIVTENDFFDFEAKYKGESKEITPAKLSDETRIKVENATLKVFQVLNLDGVARVDFIIQNDEPYMIEVNTVPGLSSESLIPQQAIAMGYTLPEFFETWVKYSMKN
jgi:D-alanine-D-alanine ligase